MIARVVRAAAYVGASVVLAHVVGLCIQTSAPTSWIYVVLCAVGAELLDATRTVLIFSAEAGVLAVVVLVSFFLAVDLVANRLYGKAKDVWEGGGAAFLFAIDQVHLRGAIIKTCMAVELGAEDATWAILLCELPSYTDVELLRYALGIGVDPNATDGDGVSLLEAARGANKPEFAALLLERGARDARAGGPADAAAPAPEGGESAE